MSQTVHLNETNDKKFMVGCNEFHAFCRANKVESITTKKV